MKKRVFAAILCAVLLVCGGLPAAAAGYDLPEDTKIHAASAIVVSLAGNPEGDVLLYEKEADAVRAPGSMMRYMVLAYALHRVEELGLDIDTATGTYTLQMYNQHVSGTGVYEAGMAYGEEWTLRSLMQAAFMHTASDAVTTLAYALDGGVTEYVEGMNRLAEEIGCDYTHFANLTGLDSLSQYTTARDMYRIVRYAQSFSLFEDLASHYQVEVTAVSGGGKHTIISANRLLQSSSSYHYDPLVHSRTGRSEHEGYTCASVARDSGYEYLVVVMGCPVETESGETGAHYVDTKNLFRWAFRTFEYKTVLGKSETLATVGVNYASGKTDRLRVEPAREIATVIDKNMDVQQIIKRVTLYKDRVDAPIEKGTVLGKVELIVNVDQKIGEVELVAAEGIERSAPLYALNWVSDFLSSWYFWGIIVALVVLVIAYVVLVVVHNRRRRNRRMQRLGKGR